MATVDASSLRVYAQKEGSVVFPKIPLLRLEGPLAICQLVETTLLNLVNYPSLLATNAARIRNAAGEKATLLEFGLRRAQGPDGAMSASKYAYIGGFDGTSNVLSGLTYNVPIKGTHAHSFVSSYTKLSELKKEYVKITLNKESTRKITYDKKIHENFIERVLFYRNQIKGGNSTNDGELASFISYASAFPKGFLALIDTYDTLTSGVLNFLSVALALYIDFGYNPIGIRLDSGDLAYLSKEVRRHFEDISKQFKVPFSKLIIVASNDINEEVLESLNQQGHSIDSFGIGTHLVTCKRQPALGCVYKLVEIDGKSRIKVSQEISKMTIPGKKLAYRLFDSSDSPVLDLMVTQDQQPSFESNDNKENKNEEIKYSDKDYVQPQKEILCMHPFLMSKRCSVKPSRVESLLFCVWDKKCVYDSPSLKDIREFSRQQIGRFRDDYLRSQNPTPYKVSVSKNLKDNIQELWTTEVPMKVFE